MRDYEITPLPITDKHHPARRAARAYKRKCWWASYPDLEQAAFLATTKAERTYDPDYGVPIDAYMYRAAVLALKPELLRDSAPVSEKKRKLDNLKGVVKQRSVTLPDGTGARRTQSIEAWLRDNVEASDVSPEIVIDTHNWRVRVRERLMLLLTDTKRTEIAVPILLGTATSAEVAELEGVPVSRVYNATLRAKRRLQNDRSLWELWDTMP